MFPGLEYGLRATKDLQVVVQLLQSRFNGCYALLLGGGEGTNDSPEAHDDLQDCNGGTFRSAVATYKSTVTPSSSDK